MRITNRTKSKVDSQFVILLWMTVLINAISTYTAIVDDRNFIMDELRNPQSRYYRSSFTGLILNLSFFGIIQLIEMYMSSHYSNKIVFLIGIITSVLFAVKFLVYYDVCWMIYGSIALPGIMGATSWIVFNKSFKNEIPLKFIEKRCSKIWDTLQVICVLGTMFFLGMKFLDKISRRWYTGRDYKWMLVN